MSVRGHYHLLHPLCLRSDLRWAQLPCLCDYPIQPHRTVVAWQSLGHLQMTHSPRLNWCEQTGSSSRSWSHCCLSFQDLSRLYLCCLTFDSTPQSCLRKCAIDYEHRMRVVVWEEKVESGAARRHPPRRMIVWQRAARACYAVERLMAPCCAIDWRMARDGDDASRDHQTSAPVLVRHLPQLRLTIWLRLSSSSCLSDCWLMCSVSVPTTSTADDGCHQ